MIALYLLLYVLSARACDWDPDIGLWRVAQNQTIWEAATYLSKSENDIVNIVQNLVEKNPQIKKPLYIVEGQTITVPHNPVTSPASWKTSYGCTLFLEFPGQGTAYQTETDSHILPVTRSFTQSPATETDPAVTATQDFTKSLGSQPSRYVTTTGNDAFSTKTVSVTARPSSSSTQTTALAPLGQIYGPVCSDDNGQKTNQETQLSYWNPLFMAFCGIQHDTTLHRDNPSISQLFSTRGGLYYFSAQWNPSCGPSQNTADYVICMDSMRRVYSDCKQ